MKMSSRLGAVPLDPTDSTDDEDGSYTFVVHHLLFSFIVCLFVYLFICLFAYFFNA